MKRTFATWFSALLIIASLLSACAGSATPTEEPAVTEAPAKTEVMVENQAPTMPVETDTAVEAPVTAEATPVETQASAEGSGAMLPEVDPASVSGDIIAAGSSTVFPLSEAMAERFKDEGFNGNITIDSIGSGAGFERFCKNGETDIANASRAIKDTEIESCQAINRTPIEFRVGTDALAIVVSQENDFLTNVTLSELAKIYSKDVTKWSEVNASWPDEDIQRFSPGTDSGTFDYFVEAVMTPAYEKDAEKGKEAILNAPGIQLSEDDNVLVQGVEGSPFAIGYFGYAYYQENASQLKSVSVEGVSPNLETAENGSYPLARPLFIYSDATILAEKPQVAAFINFFLTYVDEEIEAVGYFPASDEALNGAKQAYLEGTK